MMGRLSEHATVTPLSLLGGSGGEPFLHDIGGTNASTPWVSMKNYARAMAYVELGTWNATDDLDECRIEAATNSNGDDSEEVTTDASGGDYDTANPIDADGDFVIIEIRAEDLPDSKPFIRLYVAEGGNTGTDNVGGFLLRYGYAYPQKELQGAAATGSKVYVQP